MDERMMSAGRAHRAQRLSRACLRSIDMGTIVPRIVTMKGAGLLTTYRMIRAHTSHGCLYQWALALEDRGARN